MVAGVRAVRESGESFKTVGNFPYRHLTRASVRVSVRLPAPVARCGRHGHHAGAIWFRAVALEVQGPRTSRRVG